VLGRAEVARTSDEVIVQREDDGHTQSEASNEVARERTVVMDVDKVDVSYSVVHALGEAGSRVLARGALTSVARDADSEEPLNYPCGRLFVGVLSVRSRYETDSVPEASELSGLGEGDALRAALKFGREERQDDGDPHAASPANALKSSASASSGAPSSQKASARGVSPGAHVSPSKRARRAALDRAIP
jgi:hypothetical protein